MTYAVIRTWANWDSVHRVTVAVFPCRQQAQERADQEAQAERMMYDYPSNGFLVEQRE